MSMYQAPLLLLPLSRLHHFSCLSVGNKQSLCPLMWGAQEKSEGHTKIFSAGALRRHCAPNLQIGSDATDANNQTYARRQQTSARADHNPLTLQLSPPPMRLRFHRPSLNILFGLLAALHKNYPTDFHKIRQVAHGPRKKLLDFGGNPDDVTSGLRLSDTEFVGA